MAIGLWLGLLGTVGSSWAARKPPRAKAGRHGPALVDLTHVLTPTIPVFPGGTAFYVAKLADYENGYFLQKLETGEHTGTHLDAPAHFVKGTPTVDAIPARDLRAPAVVIDVAAKVKTQPDYRVSVADLMAYEKAFGRIPDRALVIARTGWDERWDDPGRYRNADAASVMHFPGFSAEAVEWLLAQRPTLVGLGIDTFSIDYGPSTDFVVHHKLLGAWKYGLENLTNLGALPARGATVYVAPLKIAGGSGAPARVLAEVP